MFYVFDDWTCTVMYMCMYMYVPVHEHELQLPVWLLVRARYDTLVTGDFIYFTATQCSFSRVDVHGTLMLIVFCMASTNYA